MRLVEIFYSIQGEGFLVGIPSVFIRLAGCNLNCRYCDTQYARAGGTEMTVEEIIDRVKSFELSYVCITGGEPLLQKETPELAEILFNSGYQVSVETNGTIDTSSLPEDVKRIIDIKCPGSGEEGKTCMKNLSLRRNEDEFKFVITGRGDFEYARYFVSKHNLADKHTVLLSPVLDVLNPELLADWILHEMPEARMNLQLHKYIWPSEKKGR